MPIGALVFNAWVTIKNAVWSKFPESLEKSRIEEEKIKDEIVKALC